LDAGAGARHGILQEGCVVDRDEPAVRQHVAHLASKTELQAAWAR
jgi:hypothetical protein